MADITATFDEKVVDLLSTIPDCPVYLWDAPEGSNDPRYIVFVGMVEQGAMPYVGKTGICGPTVEVFEHPFFVHVYAESPTLCIKTLGQVKSKLIGATLLPGASQVKVSPSASQRPAPDGTLRPLKYSMTLMFNVSLDRGAM